MKACAFLTRVFGVGFCLQPCVVAAFLVSPRYVFTNPCKHAYVQFAVSGDLYSPRVGDVRISFRYNGKKGTEVSIIGKPQGNTIVPYRSQAGNTIELLSMGAVSADDMFSRCA